MHRAAKIGLGCLFAPLGLLVLGLILVGSMKMMGVPESRIAETREVQPLPETAITVIDPDAEEGSAPTSGVEPALRVFLDLDMGYFRIEPGSAEAGITVDADYDEGTFELHREYGVERGVPTFRLTFRSKVHWLRRLVNQGSITDDDISSNEVTVALPAGIPLDLRLKIQRSESEIDLSGLALTNLVTQLGMGSYEIRSRTANPILLDRASFDVGMGEVTIGGLALLRARTIDVKGGMGEIEVDLGGSLLIDTEIVARMRMGEMRVLIPDDALLDPATSCRAVMGEYDDSGIRGARVVDPELAKRLLVSASVLMGELSLDEFRAQPLDDPLGPR
jgi:hypothetical protein